MAGFRSAETDFAVDGNVLAKEDFDLDGFQDQEWFLCAFCLLAYAHRHTETEQPLYVSRPTVVEDMWWYQQAPYPADKVMPARNDLFNGGISCYLKDESVEMWWYHRLPHLFNSMIPAR